ncbi:unnamed protein product [Ambrosiozyma monospora]|uniref:Unnamed protein product n=1 Tax=Ambrosiozyma monospora TaxID=43982 RepID=A0A9W6YZD9_AMBMO|nr:unnamed protein product [Ambrosiozyma monospora]
MSWDMIAPIHNWVVEHTLSPTTTTTITPTDTTTALADVVTLLPNKIQLLKRLTDKEQVLELLREAYHLDRYTYTERHNTRIFAISASSLSIFAGLIFYYFFFMIHPSRRYFRHELIFGLISFDFIRALMIMIYTVAMQRTDELASLNNAFVGAIGWFTSVSIEGADLMILYFSLHIFIIILKPNWLMRFGRSNRSELDSLNGTTIKNSNTPKPQEGGLAPVRYVIYVISLVFPIIISSCVYGRNDGRGYYDNISTSYYKTLGNVYYFTWALRWLVFILILMIYVFIYFHIMSEYKKINTRLKRVGVENRGMVKDIWSDSLWYKVSQLMMMLIFPDVQVGAKLYGKGLDSERDRENMRYYGVNSTRTSIGSSYHHHSMSSIDRNQNNDRRLSQLAEAMTPIPPAPVRLSSSNPISPSTSVSINENSNSNPNIANIGLDVQRSLHREAMKKFQTRRLSILRQMRVVFIYPMSYILIWLFPFVNSCYALYNGKDGYHHVWAWYVGSFFLALSCFVNTCVFLIRETPWKFTSSKIDPAGQYHYSRWRLALQFLPGFQITNEYHSEFADMEAYKNLQTDLDSFDMSSIIRPLSYTNNNINNHTDISGPSPSAMATVQGNVIRRNSSIDPMNDATDESDLSLADFLRYTGPQQPHAASMYTPDEELTSPFTGGNGVVSGTNGSNGGGSGSSSERRPSKISWKAFSLKGSSVSDKSRKHSVASTSSINSGNGNGFNFGIGPDMMHLSNIDEIASPVSTYQTFHDSHDNVGPNETIKGHQTQTQTSAPQPQQQRQLSQDIPRPQERKTSVNNNNNNNNNNPHQNAQGSVSAGGSSLFKKNWYLRKLSATSASSSSNQQDASDGSAMSMNGSGPNSGVTSASSNVNTPVKKHFDVQDTQNKGNNERQEEELDLMDILRMGPRS